MKRTALILTVALLAAIPTAADVTVKTLNERFPTAAASQIDFEFPVGELHVEAWDGSDVQVQVKVECERRSSRCEEAARKVHLAADDRGETLSIELKGWPKNGSKGLEARASVKVPRRHALRVDMGVGELRIAGMEGDVDVDLGVGEATITVPERAVRSVNVDTGVGDAALTLAGRRIEGKGFLSKELHWSEGTGRAAVRADCGVGEVAVRLN